MEERRFFWAPMAPRESDFQQRRALGMGLASVFADLMAGYGLDFPTFGVRPGDYSTPAEFFMQTPGHPGWVGVCGCYGDSLAQIGFQLIDVAGSRVLDETSFPGPGGGGDEWTRPLALWLAEGTGHSGLSLPDAPQSPPEEAGELLAEAHAAGLKWMAGEVSTPYDREFQKALIGAFAHFDAHIGRSRPEPAIRQALLWLAQELGDFQRRLAQQQGDVLEEMGANLDPAPIKPVWEMLRKGIEQGADGLAFRACRGYVNLALGRPTAALEDFRLLQRRRPVHGHLALARAYERMEEPDQAVREFSRALRASPPDQPYVDVLAGLESPPAPGSPSMRAHLLFARGRCQWLFGRFGPALQDLGQSVREEGLRIPSLEILAHLYRDWALALDRQGLPQAADKLRRHLDVLEDLYRVQPSVQDVEAAIDAARRLNDPQALQRWQRRGRELQL
ncbi:MAG TPA: tetratricopeptide repeat protein [Acidobacteriota bacterium]|nr:tetratricopeptide repeat protein [Acidobacteriota bacterium]